MTTREDFENNIMVIEQMLARAKKQLYDWDSLPENNVYTSIEAALSTIQDRFYSEASQACKGSYCLGEQKYEQEFTVEGDSNRYLATVEIDYNRYDKQYFYVEDTSVNYVKL